jgi:hypothetical protein
MRWSQRRGLPQGDAWVRQVRERLLSWFRENGRDFLWRRRGFSTYGLLVAEMMQQRTQAKVVEHVLKEFLERFPTVYDLNRAPLREVRRVIWRLRLSSRRHPSSRDSDERFRNKRLRLINEALGWKEGWHEVDRLEGGLVVGYRKYPHDMTPVLRRGDEKCEP